MKIVQLYVFMLLVIFGYYLSDKIRNDSKILLDLKKGVKYSIPSNYLKKYELKFEKIVSLDSNIVLYRFNREKISVEELLTKAKEIKEVEGAQIKK
jgi:hypothetical protein